MKVIGITGGVGAGKSTVLEYLRDRTDSVLVQADLVGHEVMEPDGSCFAAVVKLFGKEILGEDGRIDRGRVASIVFQDGKMLEKLNQIIHPAVKAEVLRRIQEAKEKGRSFFFLEAALIFEDHYDAICDDLWYIYADESIRRQRLMDSRGYSKEKADSIFANQLTEEFFRSHCGYVIENNGDLSETYRQIEERIHSYEAL